MSPDKLFGINFNLGCYYHDRQYANVIENRLTRKEADKQLRDYIYNRFYGSNMKIRAYIISRIYYYAVRLFGKKHWISSL